MYWEAQGNLERGKWEDVYDQDKLCTCMKFSKMNQ